MGTEYEYVERGTYLSESTPIKIKNIPTGSYKIVATKGDLRGEIQYDATIGTQNLTIPIRENSVYGVIYDKSLASDAEACLTYANASEGFTPIVGGSGDANMGSWGQSGDLFDAIKCGYFTGNGTGWVELNKSNISPSNSSNYCFTKIPKIYEKVTDLGNNRKQLDLSLKPFDGSRLHPSFMVSNVEKDNIYIGRYLGYVSNSLLRSTKGVKPTASTQRATFRGYAQGNGAGYNQLSYWDWDLVNKIYIMGCKHFHSQSRIGYGYVSGNSASANTGGSDGHSWMYGTSSGTQQMSFLGIEDWWGNVRPFIDDFYGNNNVYYAGSNSNPTDDSANKTNIGSFGHSSGNKPLTCLATLNGFFLGETNGGDNTVGMCDTQWWDTGENLGYVGGYWSGEAYAGAFYLDAYSALSYSDSNIGARLTYKP